MRVTNNCEASDSTPRTLTREQRRALSRELVNGEEIGRDPRQMSIEELNDLGHEASPLSKVIRTKCLDCCSGQISEVRKCVAADCALWPYRMRKNPFKRLSEDERTELAARLGGGKTEEVFETCE